MADCETVTALQQTRGNVLLRELSELSTLNRSKENLDRLEILLTDYMVCIVGASIKGELTFSPLSRDGVLGKGAWLALQSNQGDRDDIDWTVGSHPGSVIWSTLFSFGLVDEKTRENFVTAALAGFRSSASVGGFLGAGHRSKWHVTGTAGSFAAATIAAVSLGYSNEVHQKALQLAGANIGGSALAPRERDGASGFNRSAATTLGTTAAMAAVAGAVAVENLWDGPFGLLAMFSASDFSEDADLLADGVSTTALRLFPVTGFAQSAVLAAATIAQRNAGQLEPLESLEIGIPEGAIGWLDGSRGGFWWDVKAAVASAWESKDPTNLAPTRKNLDRITVVAVSLPFGGASVTVKTPSGDYKEVITSPPGIDLNNPRAIQWRNTKWSAMVGDQLSEVQKVAKELIAGVSTPELWVRVKNLLDN